MCLQATCPSCRTYPILYSPFLFGFTGPFLLQVEKMTWWGCGKHISDILGVIPQDDWCTCEPKVELLGKLYPHMAPKADRLPGWVCKAASILH
jgi:hypothetical protein